MQIIAMKKTESVVLTLQTGEEFEVTMIQVYGEDASTSTNISDAIHIFNQILNVNFTPGLDRLCNRKKSSIVERSV